MRHHHHSTAPTVTAALLGGAAALVAYMLSHRESTQGLHALHEELHVSAARSDAQTQETRAVMGQNFLGAAAGQQHLADAINALTDRLNETLGVLMPNRAQPGGEEPPA